jgi:glutamine amidotransferase
MTKVTIIDYRVGNIYSMKKSLERTSLTIEVSSNPSIILSSDGIVLPGVGAFGPAARNIRPLKDTIDEAIDQGIPFLGSCLGLQLFFDKSEESSGRGLGLIRGKVKRFSHDVKTPHMGWNTIEKIKDIELLDGLDEDSYFYFVHSYYVDPLQDDVIAAKTRYHIDFTSILAKGNLYGTQFHPEKSGDTGAKLLENFASIIRR